MQATSFEETILIRLRAKTQNPTECGIGSGIFTPRSVKMTSTNYAEKKMQLCQVKRRSHWFRVNPWEFKQHDGEPIDITHTPFPSAHFPEAQDLKRCDGDLKRRTVTGCAHAHPLFGADLLVALRSISPTSYEQNAQPGLLGFTLACRSGGQFSPSSPCSLQPAAVLLSC